MRGLDAWLTREPDYDEPPVCSGCGGFLKTEPDAKIEQTNIRHCTGLARVITDCTHDEAVLQIIGEEHREITFSVAYAPECGGDHLEHDFQGYDSEISPDKADDWTHEPHFFREPYQPELEILLRACRHCGKVNEEPLL